MKKTTLKKSIFYLLFLGFSLPFCSFAQKSDSIFIYKNLLGGYILKTNDKKLRTAKVYKLLKNNEYSKPYYDLYNMQKYVAIASMFAGYFILNNNYSYGGYPSWRYSSSKDKIRTVSGILFYSASVYFILNAKKHIKKAVKVYNKNLLPVKF